MNRAQMGPKKGYMLAMRQRTGEPMGRTLVARGECYSKQVEPANEIPGWGVIYGCDAVDEDGVETFAPWYDIESYWKPEAGECG